MAQDGGIGNVNSVWRAGTLSADELERLAGEIRPSWEVGLDAVADRPTVSGLGDVGPSAPVPSVNGFTAGGASFVARMADPVGAGLDSATEPATVSSPPPVITRDAPPSVVRDRRAFAATVAAAPKLAAAAPARMNRAGFDDPVELPRTRTSRGMMAAIAGGAVLLFLGVVFVATHNGERPPPTSARNLEPATVANVPLAAPTPPAAVVVAPVPVPVIAPPAPVVVAPPVPAVAVAALPAPAPVVTPPPPVVAPPPPAPVVAPPPPAAVVAHVAAPVVAPPPTRPAPPPVAPHHAIAVAPAAHVESHHASSHGSASHAGGAHRRGHPAGAGFVTDSPY